MSFTHTQRAKRWGTNPFIAEWLGNAVEYCKSPDGKKQFENWAIKKFGAREGRKKILSCQRPAQKKYGPSTGNAQLWNSAGVELGVCDEAVILYHQFTADRDLCTPERTKPAPKRRRGESSADWVARRHESLLEGCKPPNVDWSIARAIAISEFDKVRDNIQGWREDPLMFFENLISRKVSLIPPPDLEGKPMLNDYMMDEAFRHCVIGLNVTYLAWSYAADLFRILARQNLSTSSAIERAYKKDTELLWRFSSCHALVEYDQYRLWWNVKLEVSTSPYFKPYFKRTYPRNGKAKIEVNEYYIRTHPLDDILDELVVKCITREDEKKMADGHGSEFIENLIGFLANNPSGAEKFSAAAYHAIGDLAIAQEFIVQVFGSPFGRALATYAHSIKTHEEQICLAPDKCFVDPTKLIMPVPTHISLWSDAHDVNTFICNTWLDVNQSALTVWERIQKTLIGATSGLLLPEDFDSIWSKADRILWDAAKRLDRKDEPGRVAKGLGLIDPEDPNRPSFSFTLFKTFRAICQDEAEVAPATTSMPSAEAIPVATPVESAARSGHAYWSETKDNRPKEKTKTRGITVPDEIVIPEDDAEDDGDGDSQQFPDALPTQFKLGRRQIKVFHRILHEDGEPNGQVRWGDFERVMRRIGFDVVQTAGSSVRFDPPARKARSISFHRPHPDSTLSPHLLKWVGARLKRCYGWTIATFAQGTHSDE